MSTTTDQITVQPVKKANVAKNTFDGKKADLYINTGKLDGKHFLVTVNQAIGRPVLIAVHL
jgi:hypothetical protein